MTARQSTESATRSRWWSLSVCSLATLIVTSDAGQLSIALPVIIAELEGDLKLAGLVALVYALVTASLYLPCGRLADLVGTGRLFRGGFLLYAISSLLGGLSTSGTQLVMARVLQATGSASIMANNFAVVTSLFPPEERGRAMGIAGGTVAALGYTLGPVIGGLITHTLGWRANFYLTATLGLIGFGAAYVLLPQDSSRRRGAEPFDFAGAVTFALAVSLLLHALTPAREGNPSIIPALGEFVLGCVSLGIFIRIESRRPYPLLDLKLFRISAFTLGNCARLVSFVAMSINVLLMPFFLQLAMGLDPLRAGLMVAPTPLALALLSPLSGWLSERVLSERLCSLGLAIMGVGFMLLGFLAAEVGWVETILALTLVGVGMGFFQTPNNNLLMTSVPPERLGVGSAFLSIIRSLGHAMGTALATAIVSAYLFYFTGQTSLESLRGGADVGHQLPMFEIFLRGYRCAYLAAAVICFVGAALSSVRVSGKRPLGS